MCASWQTPDGRRAALRHHEGVQSFDDRAADWDSDVHVERAVAIAASIRAAVPIGAGARVIEVGAGTGLVGRALAPAVGSVVLADPSAAMLAVADAKALALGIGNIRTLRYTLAADPPPVERFDLAVSLMALHHVLDTDLALRHLAAVLDPGGWIAIADLDAEDGSYHVDPAERALVLPGFGRDDLGRRAKAAGFAGVRFTTVWEIPKNGRVYPLFLMVGRRP